MTDGQMRSLLGAAALITGSLWVSGASAATTTAAAMAFDDNKLNYKACDGAEVTARWVEDNFKLSVAGKAIGPARAWFQAAGWDGKCQTVTWNKDKAVFDVQVGDTAKTEMVIRFVAHDGSRWAGLREGDGFFVALIAKPGEDASSARIKDVSDWLARKSDRFTPGAIMARHLKIDSSQH